METDYYIPTAFSKGPNQSFINVIKYSPDGRYLGVGTRDGSAGILNAFNRHKWKHGIRCAEHSPVLDIDFSENSNVLAAATNSVIILCNCSTGAIIRTINVSLNSLFTQLSFGKDKILAGATANFLIYLFENYEITNRLNYKIFNLHLTPITSLNFIDYSYIVSSDARGYCIKWKSTDFPIPQEQFPVKKYATGNNICHTSISPYHKYVLLTHLNSELTAWEILDSDEQERRNLQSSIELYQTYTGHICGDILETKIKGNFWFTSEWKRVLCGSQDRNIYVWDFETAEVLLRIRHFEEPLMALYALPNPVVAIEFASLQRDGKLCIWKKED